MSKKQSLLSNIGVQVVIAMIIGTAVGAFTGESAEMFAPLGAIFINLIKMLVIPLVAVHVPAHSDHPFRFNPITDFGLIRSPISELSDQK